MFMCIGRRARARSKLTATQFNKVNDTGRAHYTVRDQSYNQVAALPNFRNLHIKLETSGNLTVLLSHLDKLTKILHAPYWLDDLPTHVHYVSAWDKVPTQLSACLIEVWNFLVASPLSLVSREWKEISEVILINLHDRAVNQTLATASTFLGFEK